MKVQKSSHLSAFGGMNYVFEFLDSLNLGSIIKSNLPKLSNQSQYDWKDIYYSLFTIYLCGGDSIEDLGVHLKNHFVNNPFVNIPSPDTVLRRMKQLSEPSNTVRTKRGLVEHNFNTNIKLEQLSIEILKAIGAFDSKEIVIDYDNTIIFSEKKDCSMTYKKNKGYQPGVCTINENHILYIENRGGNSDAKSFQHETLRRMFDLLKKNNCPRVNHFRADAASYQYEVVKLLENETDNFYIGCRNSYVEQFYSNITSWKTIKDSTGEEMEVGEITITPFKQPAKKDKRIASEYRLIVKRKRSETGQLNMITNDSYNYRSILTNNTQDTAVNVARLYNQRGNMEKQFDILKNDFGWNNMPFSNMNENTVFLYITAILRNVYNRIINYFTTKTNGLKPHYRLKKFLFRFIILPSKWFKRSRQNQLRIYGDLHFMT